MRELAKSIYHNPKYTRIFEWGKLITITGSAQAIVHLAGLITGILIIRLLPTQEYALYTLANTMLGTMAVLADGGISAGVMSQASKVWRDRLQIGSVIATGLELRKRFALISLIVSIPILIFLLREHNAGWLTSALIALSLIPAFYAQLLDSLLEIPVKLHQDIKTLQKNQLFTTAGRFLMVCFLFIFPWTFIAIIANGLPRILANFKLRTISSKYADYTQKTDPIIQKGIIGTVKRILPGSIYYCLSGQITIWLISVFGSTASVAQIGALGRPAMVLTLLSVMFSTLVIPRFARLASNRALLIRRYLQIQAGLLLILICVVLASYVFSEEILWLLGKNYKGLNYQLVLVIIGSCLGLIAGNTLYLNIGRGWNISPFISIPIHLVTITIGVTTMDIASFDGILKFNILIALIEAIEHILYGLVKSLKANETTHLKKSI